MSYDLDEVYIDTRKTQIDTLETEIAELEDLRQVFRVEEKRKRDEIDREINASIGTKKETIRTLDAEIIQHCRDVIWV